ncbi:MAG TPA: outer membrane beta-barrel protein [Sphingobacteriaceae bacterium]
MKKILLLAIILGLARISFAQSNREVTGTVKDSTGQSVIAASVQLMTPTDTLRTATNADGIFVFRSVKVSEFTLAIKSLGYQAFSKKYQFSATPTRVNIPAITLRASANSLNEVVISGTPAVTIKEDTVEYRAADYKVRENATTEDLIKKMPGIEVDKDGNLTAQGKSVPRVKVNGKEFFGGDVKTATQNLPADLIDRIQIVEDFGDQANITGSRTGEAERILNIQIRPDRNKGYFVNGTAGVGNENRYQLTGTGNYFNNTQQISALANLNNTNASIFNFGGGAPGGGARGRGGNGGGGFMGGGNFRGNMGGGNFNFGGNDGITSVGSIGLNYRDQWSKKLVSYGSFSFFNRDNNVESATFQENLYQGRSVIDDRLTNSNTISNNYRFNWNLEFQPDSLNYIKISPSLSYSKTTSNGTENAVITSPASTLSQLSSTRNTSSAPTLGGNILLNHRFLKRGRNISLNLSLNNSNTDADDNSNILGLYYDPNTDALIQDSVQHLNLIDYNERMNASSRLLYIEPLSEKSTVEFNWNYNRTNYDNNRETFNIDPVNVYQRVDSLSNLYNYSFSTNNFGVSYRFTDKNYNYSLGISGQPTLLQGESVMQNINTRRTGFNFVPVARFTYKFARTKELNINYFGRNNEPSFQQIQPVADRTNLNYPVVGNPELNAEFNHMLNIRYNNFNFNSGRSLFAVLSANYTQDKIVTNTVLLEPGANQNAFTQETRYLNTDGYYSVMGFYSFSIPVAEKKYTFSFNGSANYINNIAFSNNLKNNIQNLILSQRLRLQINPADWIELNPSAAYTNNQSTYSLATLNNASQNVNTWSFNADGRFYFLKSLVLGIDFSKNLNSGYSSALNSNPMILNTYLEKQFFKDKRATLRLQGYDLFDENINVSRTITNNSTIDTRSNRLGRYFMMSFTMRLQKYTGQRPQNMDGPGMMRRRMGADQH